MRLHLRGSIIGFVVKKVLLKLGCSYLAFGTGKEPTVVCACRRREIEFHADVAEQQTTLQLVLREEALSEPQSVRARTTKANRCST